MKSDNIEQTEIDTIRQHNSQEINKFMICDKIFGAYIHCINEYSINFNDCAQICTLLDTIKICNIRTR